MFWIHSLLNVCRPPGISIIINIISPNWESDRALALLGIPQFYINILTQQFSLNQMCFFYVGEVCFAHFGCMIKI